MTTGIVAGDTFAMGNEGMSFAYRKQKVVRTVNSRWFFLDTNRTPSQDPFMNEETATKTTSSFAKLNSIGSRLFFAAALVLFALAVLERVAQVMGLSILRGSYTAGRMLEFSALLVTFVIALLLRQIREELKKGK